jgi:outer membrane lipoprotein carrier protein
MNRTAQLLAVLLVLQFSSAARAETADEILRRIEQKYSTLKSLSADFRQKYQNFEQVIEESGKLTIKRPGKMYWEYQQPTQKYFVINGPKSWFYVPRDRQVLVTDIQGEASTPLLLLFGHTDLRKDFTVELDMDEPPMSPGNAVIRLIPRSPQGDFAFVLLEVSPVDSMIMRLTVVEPVGGRNDYIFDRIHVNRPVPDRVFTLKLPSNVEVIQQ